MDAKSRIDQLTQALQQHNYNYYVLAAPSISDFEFDQLLKSSKASNKHIQRFAIPTPLPYV